MGVLADTFNKTFTVYRNTTASATGTDVASAIYTGTCIIRPVSNNTQLLDATNWGKEYKIWTDEDATIRVGDLIYIDSVKYGVIGIPEKEDLEDDSDSHLEIRALKR